MIEVVLVNNQRFFVQDTAEKVRDAIFAGTVLQGFTTKAPGEDSKTWAINAAMIASFREAE